MSNDELQPKPRDTASGRRRANVLLACAVALVAIGFYVAMFIFTPQAGG